MIFTWYIVFMLYIVCTEPVLFSLNEWSSPVMQVLNVVCYICGINYCYVK